VALTPGTRLGVYEVTAQIGAGGMGEVYRARDTKLDREVALKVLPELFVSDPERVARFQREAKTLAALNHPNIGGIHGLEEAHGVTALVLELVERPTLADRIAQGPIPLDEALPMAKQIADALEAAHEQGVIHRDLKPANIKVRPDGTVKVLDFGLAKALAPLSSSAAVALANSPTITSPAAMTGENVILGTAAYMSPEQARGKAVDRRADIWAFGVVLHEMLTGRRLFGGKTVSDTLAAVLMKEPAWDRIPARARPVLRRCLERDPKRQLRDIGEARFLLDEAPPVQAAVQRWHWLAWSAAAVFFAVAALLSLVHFRENAPAAAEAMRFQIAPPEKSRFDIYLPLSPDGRRIAFTAAGPDGRIGLWVRDLDSLEARLLPGTEGVSSAFWSPDSRYIAFGDGNRLKKVDASGGPPETLCESPNAVGSGGPGPVDSVAGWNNLAFAGHPIQ
jgi:tRNA A-37 threonylcarbamoyl transferase component Bud32